MLAQHHDHKHKQPDGMLFEFRRGNWLFFPEFVSKHLKPFQKETAACLPDIVHDSEQGSTIGAGRVSGPLAGR